MPFSSGHEHNESVNMIVKYTQQNPLLFLAIFATCRANQVSKSPQLDSNAELTSNDLNRGAYSDGQGVYRRNEESVGNIDSLNYGRRAALGQAVYVGRTRGLDDGSYRYPQGIARSASNYYRNLPVSQNNVLRAGRPVEGSRKDDPALRSYDSSVDKNINSARTSQVGNNPLVWNRAAISDKTKVPPVPAAGSGLRGSPSGLLGTRPAQDVDVEINTPISKSGTYDQGSYINRNHGSGIESTNYLDRSAPIGRARNYGQENYANIANINNEGYNPRRTDSVAISDSSEQYYLNLKTDNQEANAASARELYERTEMERTGKYDEKPYVSSADRLNSIADIDRSGLYREAPIGRHGYTYPDPKIEYNPRASHVPLYPGATNEENSYNNNIYGSTNNDQMIPDILNNVNDAIVISKSGYNDNNVNNAKDNNLIPEVNFGDSDAGLLDASEILDPSFFESYTDNYIPSTPGNKISDKAIIAACNDSTGYNIYNNSLNDTNRKDIGERFAESGLANRFFHSIQSIFDDSSMLGGKRVCSCDYSKCEGANCKRVTQSTSTQTQTQVNHKTSSTSCEYCKTAESQKNSICENCIMNKPREIIKETHTNINNCENCKAKEILKEVSNNYCENCKAKEMVKEVSNNYCENCKAREIVKEESNNYCENCKAKEIVKDRNHYCENCKNKEMVKEETNNNCEYCKNRETYTNIYSSSNDYESKSNCNGGHKRCKCCKCGCGCSHSCGCNSCGGCGCGHGCGCSSSCKHKKSSGHSYESDSHYYGESKQGHASIYGGAWAGSYGQDNKDTGRDTHSDNNAISSNSGSTGTSNDYSSLHDGSGYFGSSSSSNSGSKGVVSSSKGVTSSASASSGVSSVASSNIYGTSAVLGGGSGYGHIFGSFGGGGLFTNPYANFGR